MEAHLRLNGTGSHEEYPALWEWLSAESSLDGCLRWARGAPAENSLGVESWIAVAVSSGGAATALAVALGKWLSRPPRPGLVLKVTTSRTATETSRTVELELGRRIIDDSTTRRLKDLLSASSDPPSPADKDQP